jgi:hypothetical protein
MRFKTLVGIGLIVFSTSVAVIMFAGLVLVSPSQRTAGLGLLGGQGLPGETGAEGPSGQVSVTGVGGGGGNGSTTTTTTDPTTGKKTTTSGTSAGSQAGAGGTSPTPVPGAPTPTGGTKTPTPTATPVGATPTPTPKTPTPVPTPTPTPAPPSCGSANGACTAAQVAAHNSRTNCWVIYGGYYYVVTSYVNAHPGGTSMFNSATCGHNITSYLNGSASTGGQQHTHSSTAYSVLNSYKVGPVQG